MPGTWCLSTQARWLFVWRVDVSSTSQLFVSGSDFCQIRSTVIYHDAKEQNGESISTMCRRCKPLARMAAELSVYRHLHRSEATVSRFHYVDTVVIRVEQKKRQPPAIEYIHLVVFWICFPVVSVEIQVHQYEVELLEHFSRETELGVLWSGEVSIFLLHVSICEPNPAFCAHRDVCEAVRTTCLWKPVNKQKK